MLHSGTLLNDWHLCVVYCSTVAELSPMLAIIFYEAECSQSFYTVMNSVEAWHHMRWHHTWHHMDTIRKEMMPNLWFSKFSINWLVSFHNVWAHVWLSQWVQFTFKDVGRKRRASGWSVLVCRHNECDICWLAVVHFSLLQDSGSNTISGAFTTNLTS